MWHFKCYVSSRPQRFPLIRLLVLGLLIFVILPRGKLITSPTPLSVPPNFPILRPTKSSRSHRRRLKRVRQARYASTCNCPRAII